MDDKNRIEGALLGMAIAESLEGPAKSAAEPPDLHIGGFTEMAFWIIEALDKEFRSQAFIDRLILWHATADAQKLPRQFHTVFAACTKITEGAPPDEMGIPTSLDGGSAIRAVPIGLYYDQPERVVDVAIESSNITHSHELAVCSTVAAAYVTHLALNGVPPGIWANELVKVNYSTEFKRTIKLAAEAAGSTKAPKAVLAELGGGQSIDEALAFALYSCMRHPRYELAVALAVSANAPGAAAIAGAWSGARQGREAVPENWVSSFADRQLVLDQADLLWRAKHDIPDPEKKDEKDLHADGAPHVEVSEVPANAGGGERTEDKGGRSTQAVLPRPSAGKAKVD